MKIGNRLKSGILMTAVAPDYDDWELNGDILFWYPVLKPSLKFHPWAYGWMRMRF